MTGPCLLVLGALGAIGAPPVQHHAAGREEVPTTALVVIVIVLAALPLLKRLQKRLERKTQLRLRVDEAGIECAYPGGVCRRAAWADLTEVRIRTTSEGPHLEDVFWGFHTGSEMPQVIVPHEVAVQSELLDALQRRLPGLDDEAVIRAMGCGEDRFFVVWSARAAPASGSERDAGPGVTHEDATTSNPQSQSNGT
ncbi:hypothetical protein [Anaeromyxobacter oryzae]|uniref:Uncharacterized protein n=1 Tax=Anaeromyxobacter oryzae TaxID=2918170 RepID=A0ABM7WR58_9BACT|nr:hypothetical protein [Anaeromyxobacter oryzae]BDG01946.1 hypothetical protein AMOR_09420 [Anaeromyxobacter oryzae]